MHLLSACSFLPCQTVWLKNWSPRLRLHYMSLLIKRCYAELIWAGKKRFEIRRLARFSTKVQENHTLVFHWCSQERLRCRVVRRMEFDSIESMLRALELSAVLPGHSYDEALVPWQMFAFGIFVFASLESLDLVICLGRGSSLALHFTMPVCRQSTKSWGTMTRSSWRWNLFLKNGSPMSNQRLNVGRKVAGIEHLPLANLQLIPPTVVATFALHQDLDDSNTLPGTRSCLAVASAWWCLQSKLEAAIDANVTSRLPS